MLCPIVGMHPNFECVSDFSCPIADDLQLNSRVFQWPHEILTELENSRVHLAIMKSDTQTSLQKR